MPASDLIQRSHRVTLTLCHWHDLARHIVWHCENKIRAIVKLVLLLYLMFVTCFSQCCR